MKLMVIIPAYNEQDTIAEVIDSIPKNIYRIDEIEILVVDDGSTDRTAEIAAAKGVSVISHRENKGLGIAFQTGVEEGLRRGADIVVNIDADNQFDANEICKLIDPILDRGVGMVAGTRFSDKESGEVVPWIKRWGNWFFSKLMSVLTGKHFSDTQCGFRAYSRDALLRLNLFGRFTYTQEVFLDLVNKGVEIEQVPVSVRYFKEREAKISGSLLGYLLQAMIIIMRTFRDYKPLVFFGIPGVAVFGTGILFLLYCLGYWFFYAKTSPIETYFNIGIASTILGFLLIILALIADMLKRMRRNQEELLYQLKKKEYEKIKNEDSQQQRPLL